MNAVVVGASDLFKDLNKLRTCEKGEGQQLVLCGQESACKLCSLSPGSVFIAETYRVKVEYYKKRLTVENKKFLIKKQISFFTRTDSSALVCLGPEALKMCNFKVLSLYQRPLESPSFEQRQEDLSEAGKLRKSWKIHW